MQYIDFHVDTLMRMVEDRVKNGNTQDTLWENTYHVDCKRLVENKYLAQFFACFIALNHDPLLGNSHYDSALKAIDIFYKELENDNMKKNVAFAGSYKDYLRNKEEGKVSAFLTVEEGGIIENYIDRVQELYSKGVRLITLTWNFENSIGFPNKDYKYKDNGLKPFGIEVVELFNELGIIPDVSHLSDGGFRDVLKHSKRPFVASHSNARAICNHSRNLPDEFIKTLANAGGVMGLNYYGPFLQENGISSVDAMIKHIKHIVNVGGSDILCLGSDFDGIDGELEMKGVEDIHKLVNAMEKAGLTSNLIENICYRNAEKFLERYFG